MVKNNSRRRSVSRRNRMRDSRQKDLVRTRRNRRTSKPKRQSGGVKPRSRILKNRDKTRRSVIKKTRRLNNRSTRVTRNTMREAVPETINLFGNTIIRTLNTYGNLSQPLPLINARPGPGIDSAYSIVNALYLIGTQWCRVAANQSLKVVFKILTCVFIQITDSIIQSLSKRFRHPKLTALLKNAWLVAKWTVGVMGVAAPVIAPLPDVGGRASYVDTQFLCTLDYLNEIKDRMLEDGISMQDVLNSGYSDAITQACAMYYHNSVSGTVQEYNEYIRYLETHQSTQVLMTYHNEQLYDIRQRIERIAVSLIPAGNYHGPALAIEDGIVQDPPSPTPESDDEPLAIGGMLSSLHGERESLVQRAQGVSRYGNPGARPPELKDTRYVPARRRGMAGIAKKLNDLVGLNERCQHTNYPVDAYDPNTWFRDDDRTYLEGIFNPQMTITGSNTMAIEDRGTSGSKKKKKKKKKTSKSRRL